MWLLCVCMCYYVARCCIVFRLHIRVSPETRQRLQRLRTERHLNVGSWLRALIDQALDREFGPPPPAAEEPVAPVKAAPPDPIPGWTPAKVKGGVWGARFQGDTRTLPADLDGLTISVIAKSGDSWIATVTEVVEQSPDRLLVRTQRLGQ